MSTSTTEKSILFLTKEDLIALADKARIRAAKELDQDSYNAAWLHGYAAALREVSNGFDALAIAAHVAAAERERDAANALAAYFRIDLDAEDQEQFSAEYQLFEDTFGFSFSEAINDSSEHYILPDLRRRFEKDFDCNVAENDLWDTVILLYVEDMRKELKEDTGM